MNPQATTPTTRSLAPISEPATIPPLLAATLDVAVPAWLHRIAEERWSWRKLTERARECSTIVASDGDKIMFKEKGKTATAFNALAEGLACLAHCPGGVRFGGAHYTAVYQPAD